MNRHEALAEASRRLAAYGIKPTTGRHAEELTERLLRFYTSHEIVDSPRKVGGAAQYDEHHVDQMVRIKALQAIGFSLADIRELLAIVSPTDMDAFAHGELPTSIRAVKQLQLVGFAMAEAWDFVARASPALVDAIANRQMPTDIRELGMARKARQAARDGRHPAITRAESNVRRLPAGREVRWGEVSLFVPEYRTITEADIAGIEAAAQQLLDHLQVLGLLDPPLRLPTMTEPTTEPGA